MGRLLEGGREGGREGAEGGRERWVCKNVQLQVGWDSEGISFKYKSIVTKLVVNFTHAH